jgi:hypothetical protein
MVLLILLILCLPVIRRRSFEAFLRAHQCLSVGFAFCTIKHLLSVQSFQWKPVVIYGFVCSAITISQMTLILFRNKEVGMPWPRFTTTEDQGHVRALLRLSRPMRIDAGQYINIWVPSLAFFSSHPFTAQLWSPKPQTEIELFIAKRSGFTARLFRPANHSHRRALFTGPHGRSWSIRGFEQVLVFATGFGVVAALPYLQKLVYYSRQSPYQTKRVRFIWHVRSLSEFDLFMWRVSTNKADLRQAMNPIINTLLKEDEGGVGQVSMMIPHEVFTSQWSLVEILHLYLQWYRHGN